MQPTLHTSEALLLSLWRKGTMVTMRRIMLEISRWDASCFTYTAFNTTYENDKENSVINYLFLILTHKTFFHLLKTNGDFKKKPDRSMQPKVWRFEKFGKTLQTNTYESNVKQVRLSFRLPYLISSIYVHWPMYVNKTLN